MADLKGFDRLGNRISFTEDKRAEVEKLGGRVATPEELREHKTEQEYENASTLSKVAGLTVGIGARPPALEAYSNAAKDTFSAGLYQAAARKGIEVAADVYGRGEINSKKVGDAYSERIDDLERMNPTATTLGNVAGVVGGVALAAATGGASAELGAVANAGRAGSAARALSFLNPMSALSALGAPVEAAVGRGLAGVAARGAGGRALSTGLKLGARGLVEGGAYSAIEEAAHQVRRDDPLDGEKIFTAGVGGAAGGAVLGFGLGGAGSLAASGAKALHAKGAAWLAEKLAGYAKAGEAEAAASAGRGLEDIRLNIPDGSRRLPSGVKALGQGSDIIPRPTVVEGPGVVEGNFSGVSKKAPRPPEEFIGEVIPNAPPPPETIATKAEKHARQVANDLAWDSLGTTRKISDKANAKVEGGTNAIGDYILRRITKSKDPTTSWRDILTKSRADELLPIIESELAADGRKIGEIVETHNVRVPVREVIKEAGDIYREMQKDPTRIQGADAFYERVKSMFEAFDNASQVRQGDLTMSLSDLYYARAKMEGVAHELNRGTAAHEAFKTYLRKIDDMLVGKLDDAAKLAGNEGGSQIRALKREYQLGSWAKEAAEDGVNRIKGNNIIGLRAGAGAFVGLATGHPLAGLGTAIAGKVLKERGAAFGAHFLSQAAEQGVIAKAVKAVDEKVAAAAKGVLLEGKRVRPEQPKSRGRPKKAEAAPSGREQQKATIKEGQTIVKWVAKAKADPTAFREGIEETASAIAEASGPKTAEAWTTSALRAFNFVQAHVPNKPRIDPLDPSSEPPLTYEEADRLVTAHRYATTPMSVWDDLENGIVTPESVGAAKELMPEAWGDFQMHLYGQLEEHMTRNAQLSQSQRLRVYRILGIPAGADLRPEMIKRYQANFQNASGPQGGAPAKPSGSGRPVNLKLNQSGFDRVEARAAG